MYHGGKQAGRERRSGQGLFETNAAPKERCSPVKDVVRDGGEAGRQAHALQSAVGKRVVPNAHNRLGQVDVREQCAAGERTGPDGSQSVRQCNVGEECTALKRAFLNGSDRTGQH